MRLLSRSSLSVFTSRALSAAVFSATLAAFAAGCGGDDPAAAAVTSPGGAGAAGSGTGGAAGKAAGGTAGKGNAGSAGASTGGFAGKGGGASGGSAGAAGGECKVDADCTPKLPVTVPPGCAEAKCAAGVCAFVARDQDGDKRTSKNCKSAGAGDITVGDDCNDADAQVFPGAWDGPASGANPNRCGDGIDQNCSGADGDSTGPKGESCSCTPGDIVDCSEDSAGKPIEFPAGDLKGVCKKGKKACVVDAVTGAGKFGQCVGTVGRSPEVCDNLDTDCNGIVDDLDKVPDAQTWFYDGDLDTRASAKVPPVLSCFKPTKAPAECAAATECKGKTADECCPPARWKTGNVSADDCNDFNAQINALAVEKCGDDIDNNCNGKIDEGEASDAVLFYWDGDHDSYASSAYAPIKACSKRAPTTPPAECPTCNGGKGDTCANTVGATTGPCWKAGLPPTDCNDTDASKFPGAVDKCDGVDYDCDATPNTGCACVAGSEPEPCGSADTCNAGVRTCEGGKLSACSGGPPGAKGEYCSDADVDGYCDLALCEVVCDKDKKPGYLLKQICLGVNEGRSDCDETGPNASTVNPGAVEKCGDTVDNDCDGDIDEDGAQGSKLYFFDGDGDNYGDQAVTPKSTCVSPGSGWKENISNTDCKDGGPDLPAAFDVHPGAVDKCDGKDYDCNGTANTNCGCTNGDTLPCGSASTCNAGTITCNNGAWSQCGTASAQTEWCLDKDNDSYCVFASCGFYCTNGAAPAAPANYRLRGGCTGVTTDCNDDSNQAFPGGPAERFGGTLAKYCDGLDNDCNGTIDDGSACKDQVCFPSGNDLAAWPAMKTAGDAEFGGNGPLVEIGYDFVPFGNLIFTGLKASFREQRSNLTFGDSVGEASDTDLPAASSKSGKGVIAVWNTPNGSVAHFTCSYRDTGTGQDSNLGCPYATVTCFGDTQDTDLCSGSGCGSGGFGNYAGCIATPGCIDVRVNP